MPNEINAPGGTPGKTGPASDGKPERDRPQDAARGAEKMEKAAADTASGMASSAADQSRAMASGLSDLAQAWTEQTQRTLTRRVSQASQLAAARTPQDILRIQQEILQAEMQEAAAFTTRLAELTSRALFGLGPPGR